MRFFFLRLKMMRCLGILEGVLLIVFCLAGLRECIRIMDMHRFRQECEFVRNYVVYLAQQNEPLIRKYSSQDAFFLQSPDELKTYSRLLNSIDLTSLTFKKGFQFQEEGREYVYIIIYFHHEPDLSISFRLKPQAKSWVVEAIQFSYLWGCFFSEFW